VNAKDKKGRTPLHAAAANDYKEVCSFLIRKGAKVNAKDKDGITPMKGAVLNGHKDVIAFLKAHGGKK
jgi:ankyrin repeat protein